MDDRIVEIICFDTGQLKLTLSAVLRKAGSGAQPLSERASGEHWREKMCFNLRRFLKREKLRGVWQQEKKNECLIMKHVFF